MGAVNEPIRQAASMIVVRDGDDGVEMLVLERGASSRFLASYVVFPGGSVDPVDTDLALRWFADGGEAARAAAVRELVEEAGIALTAAGVVSAGDPRSLDEVHDAPPGTHLMPELCHWVAPKDVPVRFDARYYAALAPAGIEPVPDGAEAAAAWWTTPRRVLQEWERGERKLYWPTWFTVTRLDECRDVDEMLGFRFEARDPSDDELERLPRSVFWED
jgi:8-oxo-dGTP pyrophosphatase MutT (NUDIX family)